MAALPLQAADSVFVDGAFNGSWGASFPPFIPNVIGPINFTQMEAEDALANMERLRSGFAAQNCPAEGERVEYYGGDYDYTRRGEFYACTNGDQVFGVYQDFAGGDRGTIRIDDTFPDDDPPRWSGVYTDADGLEGQMRGVYQGGGIATPLARVGAQPELTTLSGAAFVNDNGLAPASFVTSFGQGLASDTFVDPELPTMLGGVGVVITDSAGQARNARLYVVSPMQLNYLIPEDVAPGPATIQVVGGGGPIATETVQIAAVAPGIFTAAASGEGVAAAVFLHVAPDGTRTDGLIFDPLTLAPLALDLGPAGSELYVFLFATGMRNSAGPVTVTVDGIPVPFAGPVAQGQFEGLDQLNLGPLPPELSGRGEVEIVVNVDGKTANVVTAAF